MEENLRIFEEMKAGLWDEVPVPGSCCSPPQPRTPPSPSDQPNTHLPARVARAKPLFCRCVLVDGRASPKFWLAVLVTLDVCRHRP